MVVLSGTSSDAPSIETASAVITTNNLLFNSLLLFDSLYTNSRFIRSEYTQRLFTSGLSINNRSTAVASIVAGVVVTSCWAQLKTFVEAFSPISKPA